MLYSECTSSCPRTCSNIYSISSTSSCENDRCYPGCQCPSGTLLTAVHDDQVIYGPPTTSFLVCVPVDECPCRYQGREYPPGSVVEVNCNTWYVLLHQRDIELCEIGGEQSAGRWPLTPWLPLLPYGYSYKASCARPG